MTELNFDLDWPSIDDSTLDVPAPVHGFSDTRALNSHLAALPQKQAVLDELGRLSPLLHRAVTLLWGTQELQNAFAKWLISGHNSVPLPYPVAEALLFLHDHHGHEFRLESAPVA